MTMARVLAVCVWIVGVWISLIPSGASAAQPVMPAPAEGQLDPFPAPDPALIPREALIGMYRAELGDEFSASKADALYQVHGLIESFFATTGLEQRKSLAKMIEASGISPAAIGKLLRIRMSWPALKPGVYYVNHKRGPFLVRYYLGVPERYDRTKAWPLVLTLATPDRFLLQPPGDSQSVETFWKSWVSEELAKHKDAIVLMPLPELTTLYGPSMTGMNNVMQALRDSGDRVNVDPQRIYLFGQSLGAFASWNLALHYPTYFASFTALAGSARADWQRVRLGNLYNTLPIVWADADDKVVRPEMSRSIVKVLKNLKIDVDFQETKGLGHNPSDAVIDERYVRMRSRVRPLYPTTVRVESSRPESPFNRVDWVQMWQPLKPGKDKRVPLRRAGGFLTVFENSDSIRATRNGNQIDLTVDNVESLRVFLNDQMVDFSKPVTITVDKKPKFEGMVAQNLSDMLMDQITLGRGWRYYTAMIDIDLVEGPTTNATTNPTTRAATAPTTRKGKITVGPGAAD